MNVTEVSAAEYIDMLLPGSRAPAQPQRSSPDYDDRRVRRRWLSRALSNSRARVLRAGGVVQDVSVDDLEDMWTAHKGQCMSPSCREKAAQLDHIVSVSRRGGHTVSNLQLLCGACNQAKGA